MGAFEEEDDEEEEEEAVEGGRPRSWRMMQFLSGPECSPSCDGAFRLRRAAAAAASSRSFNICLLGRPTGFLVRLEPGWRTATGLPGGTRWPPMLPPPPPPPLPVFSDCTAGKGRPGPRLEEEEKEDAVLREELM